MAIVNQEINYYFQVRTKTAILSGSVPPTYSWCNDRLLGQLVYVHISPVLLSRCDWRYHGH